MNKATLRRSFRQIRDEFVRSATERVKQNLLSNVELWLVEFAKGAQVLSYLATVDEPPLDLKPFKNFFYPSLEQQESMSFFKPASEAGLTTNKYGIKEPLKATSVPFDPQAPAVILCPAVAVDTFGQRLGRGKGFYDKFLAQHPLATRVAVVLQIQVSTQPLPADEFDQRMDWIITEELIVRTFNRSA